MTEKQYRVFYDSKNVAVAVFQRIWEKYPDKALLTTADQLKWIDVTGEDVLNFVKELDRFGSITTIREIA